MQRARSKEQRPRSKEQDQGEEQGARARGKDKTEVMRINNTVDDRIVLDRDILEDVESLTYFGSTVIAKDRGADKDIKTTIGKARSAFLTLKPA